MTVTATASYGTTGDTGAIGYQCRATATATWAPCVFSGLARGPFDFSIRAVDTADLALTPCVGLLCTGTEVPDYDATPQTVHVTVTGTGGEAVPRRRHRAPGGAPETQIIGGPHDKITPGQPVSLSRRTTVVLIASGPATFRCAINSKKVPCQGGVTVLKKLAPGPQVFVAQAVDQDGRFDATPASLHFFVPYNLTPEQGKGWTKVKSRGSFAGDYVSTTRRGAVLTVGAVKRVREVRLMAPIGPRLGIVAIRIGKSAWMKVRLKSDKSRKLSVFELRGVGSARLTGVLQVKALRVPAGGAVAVDALVAR